MAKFTSSIPLDTSYEGHILRGPAGTEFRIPDSLRAAFDAEFGTRIPGLTWTVDDEIATGGGAHPNLAAHISLGLISTASTTAHVAEDDPHVQYALDADLANHEADTTSVHGIANTATLSLNTHQHAYSSLTSIPPTFAPESHSHVDEDLPAGLARDSEVTAAIATHTSTATHGGEGSLPAGLIVMWGGAVTAIPSGWLLCDGANGTPDLRSRFIKGAAAGSDPGATGGAATHTHADHSNHAVTQPSAHTEVINHTHPITDPGHVHDEYRNSATTGGSDGWGAGDTSTNNATLTGYDTGSKVTGISVDDPSGGVASIAHSGAAVDAHSAHDSPNSEPAYYALCFIQKS